MGREVGRECGTPGRGRRACARYIPGCAVLADWARAAGHADGLLPSRVGSISTPNAHDGAPQAARAERRARTGDRNMSGSDMLACFHPGL